MKSLKKILLILLALSIPLGIVLLSAIFIANWIINSETEDKIFKEIGQIPKTKVALVLGTTNYFSKGYVNPYFLYRINAAYELLSSGKVEYLLLSGDNSHITYNEPIQMKNAIVQKGIADSLIVLDYAGFRTFDSVVRANKVFDLDTFIIVSQEFHARRAIFIADHFGYEAYGYCAEDVSSNIGFRTNIRELLARVKVFLDIYVLNTEPKYLGDKIIIGS